MKHKHYQVEEKMYTYLCTEYISFGFMCLWVTLHFCTIFTSTYYKLHLQKWFQKHGKGVSVLEMWMDYYFTLKEVWIFPHIYLRYLLSDLELLNFEYWMFVVVFYRQMPWKKSKQTFKIQRVQINDQPRTLANWHTAEKKSSNLSKNI